MRDLTLLWVDLTRQKSSIHTTQNFEDFFRIRTNSADSLTRAEGDSRPNALCFDYDFPNRSDLELLEETKRRHPSVPILMLTLQHSEELAVWSFRARVWDYFVKPVKRADIERCYDSLRQISSESSIRRSVRTNPPLPAANSLRQCRSIDQRELSPAVAYVQSNYSEKIAQKQLAEMCGMSTFRFSRMFHKTFGQTFQDFLLSYRLEKAEELLLNPDMNVSDACYASGFRDPSYFGRVFRRFHNMSPTQWRQHQMREQRPCLQIPRPGLAWPASGDSSGG